MNFSLVLRVKTVAKYFCEYKLTFNLHAASLDRLRTLLVENIYHSSPCSSSEREVKRRALLRARKARTSDCILLSSRNPSSARLVTQDVCDLVASNCLFADVFKLLLLPFTGYNTAPYTPPPPPSRDIFPQSNRSP